MIEIVICCFIVNFQHAIDFRDFMKSSGVSPVNFRWVIIPATVDKHLGVLATLQQRYFDPLCTHFQVLYLLVDFVISKPETLQ